MPKIIFNAILLLISLDSANAKQNWLGEVGYGGNYFYLRDKSLVSETGADGFSGPTIYLKASKQTSRNLKIFASFLEVNSTFVAYLSPIHYQEKVRWRNLNLGAENSGVSKWANLTAGILIQETPLVYDSSQGFVFSTVKSNNFFFGIVKYFRIDQKNYMMWDQQITIPISQGQESSNFKFLPGAKGELSYYRCLKPYMSYGISWLGQYQKIIFDVEAAGFLPAAQHQSEILNSNLQLRLNFSPCPSSQR